MKNILRFLLPKKRVNTERQATVATTTEKDFFEKYVFPLYMMMPSASQDFLKHYAPIRPELSPVIFVQLFDARDWRPRIVGAFFAAIEKRTEFREIIGELLLKSELCYAGKGYCLALATFEDEQSVEHLKKYLAHYLAQKEMWFDQADAMAALAWIDERRGTNEIAGFLELWHEFIQDKKSWDLDKAIQSFGKEMEGLRSIRQGIGVE